MLVLDTESCGGRKQDEIISLAVCTTMGETVINTLLRPSPHCVFSYYATKVHGISPLSLRSCPRLADIWGTVFPILDNSVVYAYNASADKRMLEQTITNQGLKLPLIEWKCVMKQFREYSGVHCKLSEACRMLRVKGGTHDALSDALACARVLYAIERGFPLYETD